MTPSRRAPAAESLPLVLIVDDSLTVRKITSRLLTREGFAAQAWETTYLHVLQGPDPVLEWVRGTALRPVFAVLDEAQARTFETQYAALLREAYPPAEMGTIFEFRRIFCAGKKL